MVIRKKDPSLTKIIVAILVVAGGLAGVLRFSEWFTGYIGAGVEASADADLADIRQLIEEGNTVEARLRLRPIVARVNSPDITPRALMLQAELERKAGNAELAKEHLRRATEEFSDSPHQPAAAVAYAKLLEEEGDLDGALAVYKQVSEKAPPDLRAPALSGLARGKERQDDSTAARDLYERAVREAEWDSEAWREAVEGLGRLNVSSLFSSAPTEDSKIYRVAQGDSLTAIGNKLNTTQGMLMRANNIADPNRLHLGQTIKYTPKDFRLIIERSSCRVFLLDSEGIFKVYRVGLGKPSNRTTLGRYRIGNKEKDPTWFKPGSDPIPPGDPLNELGTRWMPMIPDEEDLPTDLGIHGTIAPETIGEYSSMGCPRLFKEDVEELYDLIVRSTPVEVVEKYIPEEPM